MFEAGTLFILLTLGTTPAPVEPPREDAVVVQVSGFAHARGHAIATLFQPGDNVLHSSGRKRIRASILAGKAEIVFSAVPPGSYAVVVFHDENDNGKVDHTFWGWPKEPLGFSNGFSLGPFSGKPTFEKLRFDHAAGIQRVDVCVK